MFSRLFSGVLPFVAMFTALLLLTSSPLVFSNSDQKESIKSNDAGLSALKVGKDEDGNLRNTTSKEDKKLAKKIQKEIAKYPKHTLQVHANGAKSIVIVPQRLSYTAATIGPDGKLKFECTTAGSVDKAAESSEEKEK